MDELHEKVDALQEKLDEIEANQDSKTYVNPIDLQMIFVTSVLPYPTAPVPPFQPLSFVPLASWLLDGACRLPSRLYAPLPTYTPIGPMALVLASQEPALPWTALQSTWQAGSDHAHVCLCRWSYIHDFTNQMLKRPCGKPN
jgi:hypothetical protein